MTANHSDAASDRLTAEERRVLFVARLVVRAFRRIGGDRPIGLLATLHELRKATAGLEGKEEEDSDETLD